MAVTKNYQDDPTLIIYYGTAAERAAMSTSAVAVGSRFFESDTMLEYVWAAGNGWIKWHLHLVA